MTADKIIVTIAGLIGTIFIFWFFLMKREKVVKSGNSIDITVEGGYSPDIISIPVGQTTKINFLRRDPSSCLEEVVLPDFKIRRNLPLNQTVSVEIKPKKAGEYGFACGMNMFHGKILVKEES